MLFETIKIVDGQICNLTYHQERVNYSRKELFGYEDILDLSESIKKFPSKGIFRAKIVYEKNVIDTVITPYIEKPIKSLKLVNSNIAYPYKYLNRVELDVLYNQRGSADDVLIIKDGLVTDTTIANVIFFDGEIWHTPKTPLLKGTCRTKLLKEVVIQEKIIMCEDINKYKKIGIINALRGISIVEKIV